MSIIEILQDWYENICGGSVCTGIKIETVDNCGWSVSIDLFNTAYEDENFDSVFIKMNDICWYKCSKENGIFMGYGGIQNLGDILNVFYDWVKG